MPRVASDKTITHRIEFGIPERAKIEELFAIQKENQRLDAVTGTLQAVGTGLAGGGIIFAAIALAGYLAPGIIKDTYTNVKNAVNSITQSITDPIVSDILDVDEIKQSQNAAINAGRKVNTFCDPNSIHYDEQKCATAQSEFAAAKQHAKEVRDAKIAQANAIKDEIKAFREGDNDSLLRLLPFGSVISETWALF